MSRRSTKSSKCRLPKPTSSIPSNGVKIKKKFHRVNLHRVPRGIRIAVDLSAHRPSRLLFAYSDLKCFPGALFPPRCVPAMWETFAYLGCVCRKTNCITPSVSHYVPKLEKQTNKKKWTKRTIIWSLLVLMDIKRVAALFGVLCCKRRHDTHSLVDTREVDWGWGCVWGGN